MPRTRRTFPEAGPDRPRAGLARLGGILALSLAACTATPTPLPSAADLLQASVTAMQSLRTVHFILERSGAPAYVDADHTFIFNRAEGDFVAPDQAHATVRVIGPALVAEVNVVALGEAYWETNPFTQQWGNYSGLGYNPATLFNSETGLPGLLRQHLTHVQFHGLETLADYPGQKFFHLSAETTGEPVQAMTLGMMGRGRVTLDWWAEARTRQVVQMRLVEPETDPTDPTVWLAYFEAFDAAVTITPPAP